MNFQANKTILLIDDHVVVRQGLKSLLQQWGYTIVAEGASGEEAILLWQKHQPNLAIIDLDMPGIGGLEALNRILLRDKSAKVLIYSMHDDSIYATRAMQAGAKGYVIKTDDAQTLLDAVSKIISGHRYIGQKLAQNIAIDHMDDNRHPLEKLTNREFEVFRQIVDGNSLSQISTSLNISYKTVANIQTQIKQKLDVQTTANLVHIAILHGVVGKREPLP